MGFNPFKAIGNVIGGVANVAGKVVRTVVPAIGTVSGVVNSLVNGQTVRQPAVPSSPPFNSYPGGGARTAVVPSSNAQQQAALIAAQIQAGLAGFQNLGQNAGQIPGGLQAASSLQRNLPLIALGAAALVLVLVVARK